MIKTISISKFTAFKEANLSFSRGINVFIGENSTGKTHLLKLLYSSVKAMRRFDRPSGTPSKMRTPLDILLEEKLTAVFRPEYNLSGRLVRRAAGKIKAAIELKLDQGSLGFTLANHGGLEVEDNTLKNTPESIFLPAREVLSIFEGFVETYEEWEIKFDETYYDLCVALGSLPRRGPRGEEAAALYRMLSEAIRGKVKLEGRRFYVASKKSGKFEAHLVAEGYRKIASIMHLIANGSLKKNDLLFWDEPEANLNPKLVKVVSDFLLRLAGSGVQVFVATHDYLLTNQLSLQNEYKTAAAQAAPIEFFAFNRTEEGISVETGRTLSQLKHNSIMDEFEALYERERRLFTGNDR